MSTQAQDADESRLIWPRPTLLHLQEQLKSLLAVPMQPIPHDH
uniref:Uncharacterized protein n=1 Tax=Arundo donax TaxID=35708 RepID=A0A0A9GSF6_ARUDO